MIDPHAIARALGGEVSAGQALVPAIGHSAGDRSVAIRVSPDAPDGILVHVFSGGDPLAEKDRVLGALGISRTSGRRATPQSSARAASANPVARPSDPAETERTARALEIYREADTFWGSPVEAYLVRERGLQPFEGLGRAIRYHPACPFGSHRTPAMVALVRDVRTNEPRAIHRTALTLDGRKAEVGGYDRLTLGPVSGGAIKLTPDEEVTLCLGVGEGIESALSLRRLSEFGASPVWSLISANGIERLPVLAGVESLWLAVDHDSAGISASEACAERWRNVGAEAFLVKPLVERSDLNDVFRERLHA